MKKLILITLLPFFTFAQYPDAIENDKALSDNNFYIENNLIFWQKIYEDENPSINHPKLNNGKALNMQLDACKGTSFFLSEKFNFDYSFEKKENKYRITVYNIVFKNSINLNLEYAKTDIQENNFEFYMLKKGKIKTNNTATKNLNCLNNYLDAVFQYKTKQTSDW